MGEVALRVEAARGKERVRLTAPQRRWLERGLSQPGGKLPLFDRNGQRFDARMIRGAIENGFALPWFSNPIKPDWLVCRLSDKGRAALEG